MIKKDGSAIVYLNQWSDLIDSPDLSKGLYNHFSYLAQGEEAQQQLQEICEWAKQADITGKEELKAHWDFEVAHVLVVYFDEERSKKNLLIVFPPLGTSKISFPDKMKGLWVPHNGLFFIDDDMDDPLYRICPITQKGMYSSFDYDDASYNPDEWLCVGEDNTGKEFYMIHKKSNKLYYHDDRVNVLNESEDTSVLGNWFIRKVHNTLVK